MDDVPPSSRAPEKPTVKFQAITDRALLEDLTQVVKQMRTEIRADMHLISSDMSVLKDRVVIIEKWKIESDERATKHSGGARELANTDSRHDESIASIVVSVNDLTKSQAVQSTLLSNLTSAMSRNTALTDEIKTSVTSAIKHPAFIAMLIAVVTFVTGWMGAHTP